LSRDPQSATATATATAVIVPQLLKQPQAWAFIGVTRANWYRMRSAGELPDPVEVPGGELMWRRADLEKWVARLKPARRRRSPRPVA
jgi:predicted DNA-binding transcriptional regulator AlpA